MTKGSLRKYLHNRALFFSKLADTTVEKFVADFGEECIGHSRHHMIAAGAPKKCFTNAAGLAMDKKKYVYVEGYARSPTMPPFLHAWCVLGDRVVDPTLRDPEKYEYLGVRVPTPLLISIITKQNHYGILTGSCSAVFRTDWSKSHAPFSTWS